MDFMTMITNTFVLLKFAFNIREFIDIILGSLKEHYGFLFEAKQETDSEEN